MQFKDEFEDQVGSRTGHQRYGGHKAQLLKQNSIRDLPSISTNTKTGREMVIGGQNRQVQHKGQIGRGEMHNNMQRSLNSQSEINWSV